MKVDGSDYCGFLCERVLTLLSQLEKEIPGVRKGGDIEHIHRMRVASRRIRAALSLLDGCPGSSESRRMRRSIRSVTRALGAARDADVQIAFLARYAALIPTAGTDQRPDFGSREGFDRLVIKDEKPPACTRPPGPGDGTGIWCLLLRLVQERESLQPEVLVALTRLEERRILERMKDRFARRVERWHGENDGPARTRAILSTAHATVASRAGELAALAPALLDPALVAEHHAMRIVAKRLRYTIEAFAPLFEDSLRTEVKAIKGLQEVLGDLHDCDVWIELLPRFLAEERVRTLEYFGNEGLYPAIEPGILTLLADRQSRRVRVHEEARSMWRRLEQEQFLDRLVARFAFAGTSNGGEG